ncbi:hypothetical protein R6Q59_008254 [Mikania micrantha]
MAELGLDAVEEILVRLDVEDLIRCKSVCKSWLSFISSTRFVKAHLKHNYNNDRDNHELGHRRISSYAIKNEDDWLYCNGFFIVGSCNGLVCISPEDVELVVTNPSTRELKKLPPPPYRPHMDKILQIRGVVCWGFGYDSSADDYKVVAGFRKSFSKFRTRFHVLTLKSNIWKVVGEVKYRNIEGKSGVLCGGALHWFMIGENNKKVIVSLDLSTDELKEIPQPNADLLYECKGDHRLGVIDESLCIYSSYFPLSSKKWVMKNKWELYDDPYETKYDVVHYLILEHSQQATGYLYGHDGGTHVPSIGDHIRASVLVRSLVSPHPYPHVNNNNIHYAKQGQEGNKSVETGAKVNMRKRKRRKRYSKHKTPLVCI